MAWQEGATSSDIAAAVVDRTGQVLGGGAETLSEAANGQTAPALSYDTARGRYLAVWADYRNSAEEPDVYSWYRWLPRRAEYGRMGNSTSVWALQG